MRIPLLLAPLLAAVPLALVSGCSREAAAPGADEDAAMLAIHMVENAQMEAFDSRDLETALSPYAADSAFVVSGAPYVEGLANLRPGFEAMLADPNAKLEMTPRRHFVSSSGDLAVTVSDYVYTHSDPGTGEAVSEAGVNQTVWVKQGDGSWKNLSDFNVSVPAAEAASE